MTHRIGSSRSLVRIGFASLALLGACTSTSTPAPPTWRPVPAAAFDRPVVSLFGPTFIEWTETYYAKGINLQEKVPCGPCQLRVCPLDHRCMRDLSVERVFAASKDLLTRFPARRLRHAC